MLAKLYCADEYQDRHRKTGDLQKELSIYCEDIVRVIYPAAILDGVILPEFVPAS